MPAEFLRAEVGYKRRAVSLAELLELKRVFGTSVQAIANRLHDLGIIGEPTYRQLFERFEQLGWMRPPYPEPQPMPKVEPQRFKRLCFRALAEGIISETAAMRLMDMSGARLRRALREPQPGHSKSAHRRALPIPAPAPAERCRGPSFSRKEFLMRRLPGRPLSVVI